MSLGDIIDWVEENPRDAGIRIFALERENIILERENAALRELVGSVPREVFLDNGETSQRALANYEAFNVARKEAKL